MDHLENPTRSEGIVYADRDESIAMQVAFPEEGKRSYVKVSLCIALYAVLALIWMPGFNLKQPVYQVTSNERPVQRRKVLRPPPEKPAEAVVTVDKKAKKMPMPDMTPDDPEPLLQLAEQVPPTPVATEDWEIGIPDGPPASNNVAIVGQDGVEAPIFIKKVPPKYPADGIQVRLQGYVVLQAILKKDGYVSDIKVLRGLGKGRFGFEDEAIASLKQWSFLPGKVNGKPEDVRMNLRVDFILQ